MILFFGDMIIQNSGNKSCFTGLFRFLCGTKQINYLCFLLFNIFHIGRKNNWLLILIFDYILRIFKYWLGTI